MSFVSKASALALFALAALPFAACGGSGSSNPNAGTCSPYCQVNIACVDPTSCVLADPAGAEDACTSACEAGFAPLTPAEASLVTGCLSCLNQAAAGKCPSTLPTGTCDSVCKGTTVDAAGQKWGAAAQAATPSGGQCTNGKNAFGAGSCSGGGDATSCTQSCCNGSSCTTPDVAISCTLASPAMCTCTAGKNKGKTFSAPSGCSTDPWNACNL